HNHGKTEQTIEAGERIAQMVIAPFITANFIVSDSLEDTVRGAGGFGSTGTK
ncbi:MAG: dUTP diphosphatase, partial [Clostridia bacterium]|nr:dUTP diphosphatase [Clostridia bacterium]